MPGEGSRLAPIREPANQQFARMWDGWRGAKLLPARRDVDLNSIRSLLARVMLIEVQSPGIAIIRVFGTQLREDLGEELTGANYVELAPPDRRAIRSFRQWQSVSRPCGSRLVREHRLQSGRVYEAEVVTLPLDPDRAGAPRQLMSHFALTGERYEVSEAPDGRIFDVADDFTFLDIGAGVPERTTPAD